MLGKFSMYKSNGCRLKHILVLIMIYNLMQPCAMAQSEGEKGWIWSVKTGDIKQLNNTSYIPNFYMPNDTVNISWNINAPSDTDIKNVQLNIYPTGEGISGFIPKDYKPIHGLDYKNSIYERFDYIPLDSVKVSPGKTYNVELRANATKRLKDVTESKDVNETHIIEIKIKTPGDLVLRKFVPKWKDASLSSWNLKIRGPNDFPPQNQISYRSATDKTGVVRFAGLRPGNYTITEESKDGWKEIDSIDVVVQTGANFKILNNTPNILKITKVDSKGQPLSNWAFKLVGQNGQGTFTAPPTDSSGVTTFKGFSSGAYDIQEDPVKSGWRRISVDASLPIRFGSGENKSIVITNAEEGSISITKRDTEGNPLGGWSFSITGPDNRNVITNSDGVAFAGGLLPGDYTIRESMQQGWQPVTDPVQAVTLNPGAAIKLAFVNNPELPLTIVKFQDKNGNGQLDRDANGAALESGLSGWTFKVEGPNGFNTTVGPTNSEGIAIVRDLTPGEYRITEDISQSTKPGWICKTANPQVVKVSRNKVNRVEFGNKVNRLTLVSFNDLSMNGKREQNETGLPGWTFVIRGPNEMSNPPAITTSPAGADGSVVVEGLKPGTYSVTENPAAGWINTSLATASVQIPAGEERQLAFGNIKPSRIEIFKFNDSNRNGSLDAGEAGMPGWSFRVTGPGNFAVTTSPTDSSGVTAISGLLPGIYIITEPQVDRWINTTPLAKSVTVGFGDSQRVSFSNFYCPRCFRINDQPKAAISIDQDLRVTKRVSNISAENINKNGYPVSYIIEICPSRGIDKISAVPTDIVIAVDNTISLSNIGEMTISGVRTLVNGTSKYDTEKVTRIGLVSWSDKGYGKIQAPLTNDYDSVALAANKIVFPEGNHTDYQEAINTALRAFEGKESDASRVKKIVFITDANDSGYIAPSSMPGPDYSIYAIIVGNNQGKSSYATLAKLTRDHQGDIRSIDNVSEMQQVLIQMATAGPKIKDVRLVETLPNYLVLDNSSALDDSGRIKINGDNKEWTTTTISWDIGDLSGCWNTSFEAIFCWKLPADVNQPKLASYVNYTDYQGSRKSIPLPEYEINIVSSVAIPQSTLASTEAGAKKQPGFGSLFAGLGLIGAVYLYRRLSS